MKSMITIRQDFVYRYKEKFNKYLINSDENINEYIRIYNIKIEDISIETVCPYCKHKTTLIHHYKERYFYDGSVISDKDYIYDVSFICKTYECKNKKCKKFFTPSNPFVKGKEHYTNGFKNVIRFLHNKNKRISEIVNEFNDRGIYLNRNIISKIIKNK